MENSRLYLFVVWHRGMPEFDRIESLIKARFTVLKQFEVVWRRRDFLRNFAAFYGWKGFAIWAGKMFRSGTGPFRALVVRDEHPDFTPTSDDAKLRAKQTGCGIPELKENANVYSLKIELRKTLTHSNVVHASVNEAETRHNLQALLGQTPEEFAARGDLDGAVERLEFTKPIAYHPFKYAEVRGKGPQFFEYELKLNRVTLFFFPRCGVPTIFSCSFRLLSLFNFAFCLGNIKMGYRQSIK